MTGKLLKTRLGKGWPSRSQMLFLAFFVAAGFCHVAVAGKPTASPEPGAFLRSRAFPGFKSYLVAEQDQGYHGPRSVFNGRGIYRLGTLPSGGKSPLGERSIGPPGSGYHAVGRSLCFHESYGS